MNNFNKRLNQAIIISKLHEAMDASLAQAIRGRRINADMRPIFMEYCDMMGKKGLFLKEDTTQNPQQPASQQPASQQPASQQAYQPSDAAAYGFRRGWKPEEVQKKYSETTQKLEKIKAYVQKEYVALLDNTSKQFINRIANAINSAAKASKTPINKQQKAVVLKNYLTMAASLNDFVKRGIQSWKPRLYGAADMQKFEPQPSQPQASVSK